MSDLSPKSKPEHEGHRERLRQRFLESQGAGMPDYEILELLLFPVIPRRDVKPLAKALIKTFGSLGGVLSAGHKRLKDEGGLTDYTAAMLCVTREAGLRMLRAEVMHKNVISHWQALLDYCAAQMAHEPIEQFRILFLDKKNALIADEVQQRGTVDHTPVYPREVVRRALELSASAMILVHNHPSGDPAPSRADIDMTKQIRDALNAVGIALHDHVIIGKNNQYFSFKSHQLL